MWKRLGLGPGNQQGRGFAGRDAYLGPWRGPCKGLRKPGRERLSAVSSGGTGHIGSHYGIWLRHRLQAVDEQASGGAVVIPFPDEGLVGVGAGRLDAVIIGPGLTLHGLTGELGLLARHGGKDGIDVGLVCVLRRRRAWPRNDEHLTSRIQRREESVALKREIFTEHEDELCLVRSVH